MFELDVFFFFIREWEQIFCLPLQKSAQVCPEIPLSSLGSLLSANE